MLALFDSSSEINAIHLNFAKRQGFSIKTIDIRAQKINDTMLNTYKILVAAFSMINQANQVKFFEKTCLMANVSPEVILKIFFLALSSANIDFLDWELW